MSGAAVAIGAAQFVPGVDAVVDAVLVVGAIGLGIYALTHAHSNSQALKDTPQTHACADCGDGPDCFEPPDRNDPEKLAEFRRQLKNQQDAINQMSPDQLINNIDRYAQGGRAAYPGEAASRQAVRQGRRGRVYDRALRRYSQDPATAGNAEALATQEADGALAGQSALHNPDLSAGGNSQAVDLGDSGINASLGSQWAKKAPGSQLTRAQQLRKAAERAKAQGKSKMDVDLNEC